MTLINKNRFLLALSETFLIDLSVLIKILCVKKRIFYSDFGESKKKFQAKNFGSF